MQQAPDPPNPTLKPDETNKVNTTESAGTETLPAVIKIRLDSTVQADPEPSDGLSTILEAEAAPAACSDAVPSPLPTDQTEAEAPDDSPEVLTPSHSAYPDPGSLETLVGSRSPAPLPRIWTRPCNQPERYVPVCILHVLPVNQAQAGPSTWLFPTMGIVVTLSTALSSCPTNTLNSAQTESVLLGMSISAQASTL